MITPKASNWVYRGEPPEPTLSRVLGSYLQLDAKAPDPVLTRYVLTIRGMAEADATEVHIAEYLKTLEEHHGITDRLARHRRAVAIALWHITKCAEVRDHALRLLGSSSKVNGRADR
jgi:hypothetical protein